MQANQFPLKLRDGFVAALRAGDSPEVLLKLVHQHQEQGLSSHDAYDILHGLWLELGFHNTEASTPLQDNLEYVLERVWYDNDRRQSDRDPPVTGVSQYGLDRPGGM